jgi:hypothetical protein
LRCDITGVLACKSRQFKRAIKPSFGDVKRNNTCDIDNAGVIVPYFLTLVYRNVFFTDQYRSVVFFTCPISTRDFAVSKSDLQNIIIFIFRKMGLSNAKLDPHVNRPLRLIYTSNFRVRFRSKLVPFTDYNYFCILANGLA